VLTTGRYLFNERHQLPTVYRSDDRRLARAAVDGFE